MKKVFLYFLILGTSPLLTNCLEEELNTVVSNETNLIKSATGTLPTVGTPSGGPSIVRNQIVVRYRDPNLSQTAKNAIKSTYEYEYSFSITQTNTCNCGVSDLELWTIDTTQAGFAGIEGVVQGLQHDTGEGDLSGDYQFTIEMIDDMIGVNESGGLTEKILDKSDPNAIKIAIIDSGVDYNFFDSPFLYNSSNSACSSRELSGWDFVNKDGDPIDDKGHGTFVANIITDALDDLRIPHEILAIKAFDDMGKGSYFDVNCAILYALSKKDIDMINMSFGWYQPKDSSVIMKQIMDEYEDKVLFITSSGNEGRDTDKETNFHLPSGYNSRNLLTVGGYVGAPDIELSVEDLLTVSPDQIVLSEESNYGYMSIDIATPYMFDLSLESNIHLINVTVHGTSYSSAFTTAQAAELLYAYPGMKPTTLKNRIISLGYDSEVIKNQISSGRILNLNRNEEQ